MGWRHYSATLAIPALAVSLAHGANLNSKRERIERGGALSVFEFLLPEEIEDVASYAGRFDVTKEVRRAVAYASSRGKSLFLPAGLYKFASGSITVPMGMTIRGEGWGELPISTPNHGTVIRFEYPASLDPYGFYVTGSGAQIRDLEIDETQALPPPCGFVGTLTAGSSTITNVSYPNGCRPTNGQLLNAPNVSYGTLIRGGAGTTTMAMAPATNASSAKALSTTVRAEVFSSGAFTPSIGPWAIYAGASGSRLSVDHIMLRNVYDGIALIGARGGYLNDILGQPIDQGIRIEGDSDEPHLSNIHFGWTYWTGNPGILAWQHANAVSYSFGRVDNPQANNLFSFNANVGIHFFYRSVPESNLNGETSLGAFVNIGIDNVAKAGVLIDGAPSLSFSNLYIYPDISFVGATCIESGVAIGRSPLRLDISNGSCLAAYGSALMLGAASSESPATVHLSNFRIRRWDAGSRGDRAMRLAQNVTVLADANPSEGGAAYSSLVDGPGRLWYPGKGGPGWAEAADGTLTEWGTAATSMGTASVVWPRPCFSAPQSVTANLILGNTLGMRGAGSVTLQTATATAASFAARYISGGSVTAASANVMWWMTCIGKVPTQNRP